jgi:hypothetical protein
VNFTPGVHPSPPPQKSIDASGEGNKMENVITFTFKSEGTYSEQEKIDLMDKLLAEVQDFDPDFIEDSEDISVTDGNTPTVKELVQKELENTGLVVTVALQDGEGRVLRKLQATEFGDE